jgi:hypothetical protein
MTKEERNKRNKGWQIIIFKVVFNLVGWRFVSPEGGIFSSRSSQAKSKGSSPFTSISRQPNHKVRDRECAGTPVFVLLPRASVGAYMGPIDAPLLLSRPSRTPKPDKPAESSLSHIIVHNIHP